MEVYSYEGKKENEVFAKALSDLNVTEDEILYHKQINKFKMPSNHSYKKQLIIWD